MSSEDIVAADSAVSEMMGLSPRSVGAISLAKKKKIGNPDFSPVGEFDYFKSRFPSKTFKDNLRTAVANIYQRVFPET